MRVAAWAALALFVLGAGLVADAVLRGDAHVEIVLIFPVFSGSSAEFLGGVLAVVLGIVSLAFSGSVAAPAEGPPSGSAISEADGVGGLVLVGPVPIFFGRWSEASRRARWAAAAVGAVVLAVFAIGVYLALR